MQILGRCFVLNKQYQFHHVIPQQYGGQHVWWNGHPVAVPGHQKIVHGKNSVLTSIIKKTDS